VPKEEQEKKKQGKAPQLKGPTGEPSTSESHEQQLPSTTDVSMTGHQINEGLGESEGGASQEEDGTLVTAAKSDPDELQSPTASKIQDQDTQNRPPASQPVHNDQQLPSSSQPTEPLPHRSKLYFYLHRPRTATRQKVLIPLSPTVPFTTALRNRTILEFPTIYVLESSSRELLATTEEEEGRQNSEFILEEAYLRTKRQRQTGEDDTSSSGSDDDDDDDDDESEEEDEEDGEEENQPATSTSAVLPNLNNIDEKKVLEVLKQDLFQAT
jgi:hypothetical protein